MKTSEDLHKGQIWFCVPRYGLHKTCKVWKLASNNTHEMKE